MKDTNVKQLVINRLTQAQYNDALAANKINDDELYFVTEENEQGDYYYKDQVYNKEEINNLLSNLSISGVDLSNYYTKEEVDSKVTSPISKVSELENDSGYITEDDMSNYATIAQLASKAEASEVDSKITNALTPYLLKETYESEKVTVTKESLGLDKVDNTADLDKPISTAVQTALDLKANTADLYTKGDIDAKVLSAKAYTDDKFNDLLGTDVDETLDTIKEISEAITSDKSVLNAIQNSITTKADKSEIPTNVSQLKNDSGYLTNADGNSFKAAAVNEAEAYTEEQLLSYYTKTEIDSFFTSLEDALGGI